ncbi:MAG: rubredoxin [Rikenellaceae bacterium]|nr:rubredoxin [Rikenellaceae bacterium]
MQKWVCTFCGWVYDPEVGVPDEGISPGTDFMDLPLDFVCPVSGHPWDDFEIL